MAGGGAAHARAGLGAGSRRGGSAAGGAARRALSAVLTGRGRSRAMEAAAARGCGVSALLLIACGRCCSPGLAGCRSCPLLPSQPRRGTLPHQPRGQRARRRLRRPAGCLRDRGRGVSGRASDPGACLRANRLTAFGGEGRGSSQSACSVGLHARSCVDANEADREERVVKVCSGHFTSQIRAPLSRSCTSVRGPRGSLTRDS